MYFLRNRVYLSIFPHVIKKQLSITRFRGLGDLPPIRCCRGSERPATTTLSEVQSAVAVRRRYRSDICSAKQQQQPQPGSSGLDPRCSAVISAATISCVVREATSSCSPRSDNCHRVYAGNNLFEVHFRTLSSAVMSTQKKVCIVGSGNWGSAIARIVGFNAKRQPNLHETVTMYVYEEIIDGRKLTEIINETHENVKYLPGYQIPPNVVAVPDLVEAAKDADILIFVVPHQFIQRICSTLLGKIKATACGLSLIKGFERAEGGGIELISHNIQKLLGIPVSVLMGANIAQEVAAENFCETTIGCKDKEMAPIFQELIQTDNFRVVVVDDVAAVEVCGALKNVVAVGAGIVDGLRMGDNTKAAVIRLGLMEMIKFIDVFYPGSKLSTFFESCGVADLVTTCYGGRNRRVAEAFVTTGKSIDELEKELLNGQKLQGPITAEEVNCMLKQKDMEDRFPLMTAVHRICKGEMKPAHLIDSMRAHPEHM